MNSVPNSLSSHLKKGAVTVFSKTYCPYCDQVKSLLSKHKIKFETHELDKGNWNNQFISDLNQYAKMTTVPKVFIGEKCVGGFTEVKKLEGNTNLFVMLKKEGVRFQDDDAFD